MEGFRFHGNSEEENFRIKYSLQLEKARGLIAAERPNPSGPTRTSDEDAHKIFNVVRKNLIGRPKLS